MINNPDNVHRLVAVENQWTMDFYPLLSTQYKQKLQPHIADAHLTLTVTYLMQCTNNTTNNILHTGMQQCLMYI